MTLTCQNGETSANIETQTERKHHTSSTRIADLIVITRTYITAYNPEHGTPHVEILYNALEELIAAEPQETSYYYTNPNDEEQQIIKQARNLFNIKFYRTDTGEPL